MFATPFMLGIVLASIGVVEPLTTTQRARIAATVDGSEKPDDGFAAMVEHVRGWASNVGNEPAPPPDPQLLLTRSTDFRGELFRVHGVIQQKAALDPPWQDVSEWFVRPAGDADQRPMIVYVVGADAMPPFADGQAVTILSRFLKRVDSLARDSKAHAYPAFVGAFPLRGGMTSATMTALQQSMARLWMVGSISGGLLIAFILLRVLVKRTGIKTSGSRTRSRDIETQRMQRASNELMPGAVDESLGLPDDPAEALAELRRRAST